MAHFNEHNGDVGIRERLDLPLRGVITDATVSGSCFLIVQQPLAVQDISASRDMFYEEELELITGWLATTAAILEQK